MKVIQILPELSAGGVERGTLEVANHLVAHGHESIVISNGGTMAPALEAAGTRHITLPVHRKALPSLLQVPKLREVFLREKPDIIHLRSRLPAWLAYLAWKSLPQANRPHLITTVHGFYSVSAYSAIMTKGQRVIAVSHSVRDYITTNYPACPPENITVIHRGIDPAAYHPDYRPSPEWLATWHGENPQLTGKATLLLPGRITRLKGHEDFFALIASLNANGTPAHGLIVGNTHPKKIAYLDELHALARSMGISDHLTFLGHRSDLRDIMAATDITFSLSQQPESFGRTVLEALALGKPTIAHNFGGTGEILTTLYPQGLVPIGDSAKLLATTQALLSTKPTPAPVPATFTLAHMCQATLDTYQALAAHAH